MLRYAITDGRAGLRPGEAEAGRLAARCTEVARAGVDVLLVREKRLAAGELTRLTRRVVEAVRATGAGMRVLVAGRVDVALAAGADGVHLSSAPGELRLAEVRQLMPEAYVSVSCHTLEEVRRAGEESLRAGGRRGEGESAVLFAPVFGKWIDGVEVVPGVGLEALREACVLAGALPVFALGGVTEANAPECVAAGAAGVAGIRMFFGGEV